LKSTLTPPWISQAVAFFERLETEQFESAPGHRPPGRARAGQARCRPASGPGAQSEDL